MLLKNIKINSLYLEQAFSSLFSFLITIIVLRLFGIEIFGIFSFLWIIYLFLYSIQLSIIIYPMNSDLFKNNTNNIKYYYSNALILQVIFLVFVSIFFYITLSLFGNFFQNFDLKIYSISFPIFIFCAQLFHFFRRKLILNNFYLKSLFTHIIMFFSLLIFVFFLHKKNSLNLNYFFYCFSLSFLIGLLINLKMILPFKFNSGRFYKYIYFNWISSKWLLLSSLTQWLGGNLWLINSGVLMGAKMLGILRACLTILNISAILFQSIESFVPKKLSIILRTNEIHLMDLFLKKFINRFFLITMIITLFIVFTSKYLLKIFYGEEMSVFYYILIFLSIMLPINFLRLPLELGLRALKNTKPIFYANLSASIIAIIFSNIIIINFDISGMIAGLIFNQVIIFLIIRYYYRLNIHKRRARE